MDTIDKKIFVELDKNPRIPISTLAKKIRVSQQVADYRVKKMLERGDITTFGTIINLKKLAQEHYRIFFSFHTNKYANNTIFSWLRAKPGVYWAARTGGKYDLHVVLFCYDFASLDTFIDDFNKQFPGLVKDYYCSYVVEHHIYKHKYLSKDYTTLTTHCSDSVVPIDDLDRHILHRIKSNCRTSSLDIARGMNTTYKTVLNRIKKLEHTGIIAGYRTYITSKDHQPYILLFSFKNYSLKDEQQLISYVGRKDEITQTLRLFGTWNLYLHVRIENREKLQSLLIELRDKFDIIDSYDIIPVFEDIRIDLLPL